MPAHLLFVFLAVGLPGDGADELSRVEKASLDSRLAVRTITVSLRRQSEDFLPKPDSRRGEMNIWFDGRRLRVDHTDHYPSLERMNGKRRVECFHCLRPGTLFVYNDTDQLQSTVTKIAADSFVSEDISFDPRLLGYSFASLSLLRHAHLDRVFARTYRKNPRVVVERWNGVECQVIRYDYDGGTVAIWCDPARGHQPIRLEKMSGTAQYLVEIDLQPVHGGHWYPKKITNRVTTEGKLAESETVEVGDVTINKPISEEVFSLSGLGMRDNTHIYSTADAERDWMWRGGKLVKFRDVKKSETTTPVVPTPLHPPEPTPYWLYAVAAVLAVGAFLALRLAFRRAKKS